MTSEPSAARPKAQRAWRDREREERPLAVPLGSPWSLLALIALTLATLAGSARAEAAADAPVLSIARNVESLVAGRGQGQASVGGLAIGARLGDVWPLLRPRLEGARKVVWNEGHVTARIDGHVSPQHFVLVTFETSGPEETRNQLIFCDPTASATTPVADYRLSHVRRESPGRTRRHDNGAWRQLVEAVSRAEPRIAGDERFFIEQSGRAGALAFGWTARVVAHGSELGTDLYLAMADAGGMHHEALSTGHRHCTLPHGDVSFRDLGVRSFDPRTLDLTGDRPRGR